MTLYEDDQNRQLLSAVEEKFRILVIGYVQRSYIIPTLYNACICDEEAKVNFAFIPENTLFHLRNFHAYNTARIRFRLTAYDRS